MTDGRRPLGAWAATDFEVVAEIPDLMPTGVTVSATGRVFVSFPRWGDEVPYTVAEIVDGKAVPYPNPAVNQLDQAAAGTTLVSVQSVIVDPADRLWLLDTGSLSFGPHLPDGPKLVQVDLATDSIVRTVHVGEPAANATTYLNDVRFDLTQGEAGHAYLTDSQPEGALVVVDLASGRSWSHLRGHESTHAVEGFRAIVQGEVREGYVVGADGIAISADGSRLYWCPLSSRRLYSIETAVLRDEDADPAAVAAAIVDHGDKGAADGMETDADGGLYTTSYEHSGVFRLDADGSWSTVLHAPELLWPDTLALGPDGWLYVSINQLPRTPLFNDGVDDRLPPYLIVRTQVGHEPVRLAR